MNPLKSIKGTIIAGIVLAIIFIFILNATVPAGTEAVSNSTEWTVWLHAVVGVLWIGLLYYFNFVQVPGLAAAKADGTAPGITKHIAPLALLWFRYAALLTWLSGAVLLYNYGILADSFLFSGALNVKVIGMGAWLGTIMLFNVWVLIWPNQKKVLGLVEATDEQKAKAAFVALMASRTNAMLSIPMLLGMTAYAHNLPF